MLTVLVGASAPGLSAMPATLSDPLLSSEDVDFTEYSLEDLMGIEVTVATRQAAPLDTVPAAVYVLTGDEIRRSGHTSVPEALRMVPGFYVSRWTTHSWDVTSRGFGNGLSLVNQAYLNQLLVMIDGVVVYSPQFAGVWWPLQDMLLEDIDRIEVVRGPGGALWGTNAVHGVVHIITKHGSDTQGVQVSARGSELDRQFSARYGGKFGEEGYYRVWGKGTGYETLANPAVPEDQDWYLASFGTQFDWKQADKDFKVWARGWVGEFQNRGYDLVTFDPIQVEDDRKGAMFLASMSDPEAGSRWQAWYSTDQQDLPTLADIRVDTLDLEYQRTTPFAETHSLNWGVGYRYTHSYFFGDDPFWLAFDPEYEDLNTFRAFAMDTVPLGESDVTLTYGAAIEYNELTEVEVQPTIRATWTPEATYMVWAAISRAVRTPSLEETSDSFWGNKQFESETLIAYELGSRWSPKDWVSADLAVYFNDYDDLHYLDPTDAIYVNDSDGEAYGAELALDFQPAQIWKLRSTYTYHHGSYQVKSTGEQLPTDQYSPKHALSVRSYLDIATDWEFDMGLYGIDGMGDAYEEAEYIRLDARLGWTFVEGVEAYIGVQGATEPQRSEYDEFDQLRRTAYLGIRASY
jgi:iron complex outermembrane recepter protein